MECEKQKMFEATNRSNMWSRLCEISCEGLSLTTWVHLTSGFSQVSSPAVKTELVPRGVSQVAAGVMVQRYLCFWWADALLIGAYQVFLGGKTWGFCRVVIPWWSCLLWLKKTRIQFQRQALFSSETRCILDKLPKLNSSPPPFLVV